VAHHSTRVANRASDVRFPLTAASSVACSKQQAAAPVAHELVLHAGEIQSKGSP
jgi:hypothetical protein